MQAAGPLSPGHQGVASAHTPGTRIPLGRGPLSEPSFHLLFPATLEWGLYRAGDRAWFSLAKAESTVPQAALSPPTTSWMEGGRRGRGHLGTSECFPFQVSPEMLEKIPVLRSLRDRERRAGKDVTLRAEPQCPAPPHTVRTPQHTPQLGTGAPGAACGSRTRQARPVRHRRL